MTPLVSAIVPAFNHPGHLRAAVESVFGQSERDWELVIADDGSDDGETRAYLASLAGRERVTVVPLPHSGRPSVVRNAAIRAARGTYLAFLDSDDLWLPSKLEVQMRALRAEPGRRWSYSAVARIDERGEPIHGQRIATWVPHDGAILERLLTVEALVATPTVIAERQLVLDAGGFDEEQPFCEDYDLWLRLATRSDVAVVAEPLACVRVHGDSYSRDRRGTYAGWERLYRKMADSVSDPGLRALCLRRRAESAAILAGLHAAAGDHAAEWRTRLEASRYAWRFPQWWLGVAKATGRAVLPSDWVAAYDRRRRRA